MDELNLLQRITVWAIPVIFAITVHETAHGVVALRLGDPTAKMLGRLTLNPVKHIDPIGTLLVPGILLLLPGSFLFGWAKPVPITWQNLKQPRRDMALVALGGPLSNLLMALLWAGAIQVGLLLEGAGGIFLIYTGVAGIFVNIILAVLNLVPLPPLDGGRVLTGLLPPRAAWKFSQIEPYGLIILVLLLVTGILGQIIFPVVSLLLTAIAGLTGLSPGDFGYFLTALLS